MSRSRKKAIFKDRGHRKNDYWRAYRRVTKPVIKKFFNYKRNLYDWFYEDILYSEYIDELIECGYSEDDAYKMASIKSSYDYYVEPELKSPKELINDYDYSDYTMDYEYRLRYDCYTCHRTGETDVEEHEEYVKAIRRK